VQGNDDAGQDSTVAHSAKRYIVKPMPTSVDFDDATRHLVRIAATVAGAALGVTRRVMTEAKGHVDPTAVDEVLLQSYLFAGFPRTLNATAIWRELAEAPAPTEDPLASIEHALQWVSAGEVACRRVYGPVYETLRDNVRALHPALDTWMVVDGYGKVLSRPALDLTRRELCIVAACAASEQMPQLRSHLRGALNCGATRDDLAHTLSALNDVIPLDAMTSAREELARLKEL
jgi:4-carboxymuconolactone decarboxylase